MTTLTRLAAVVLAGLATATCGDRMPTSPTQFSTATAGATLRVQPSVLIAHSVDRFSCPAVPPFTVPFDLLINGGNSLTVTNITMRFVDTSGVPMPQVTLTAPQVTLPAPVPTTQFGSALAASRDLPLSFAIGCGTGHAGTVTLIVATVDGGGRPGSLQLAAAVR